MVLNYKFSICREESRPKLIIEYDNWFMRKIFIALERAVRIEIVLTFFKSSLASFVNFWSFLQK